jgi:hypothetical protein
MTRTQILMPERMLEWLRAEAARRGVSVSEVIRFVVQREMDKK